MKILENKNCKCSRK